MTNVSQIKGWKLSTYAAYYRGACTSAYSSAGSKRQARVRGQRVARSVSNVVATAKALKQQRRFGRWLGVQLALQELAQLLIMPQRLAGFALPRVAAHELAMRQLEVVID